MSKRVANTKARTARNGRIRYGWRVKKAATDLESVSKRLREEGLADEVKMKLENFKQAAKAILPKKLLQRHQGR